MSEADLRRIRAKIAGATSAVRERRAQLERIREAQERRNARRPSVPKSSHPWRHMRTVPA
ncbi:MAG: hypothetical protein KBD62_32175 [Kofleriaceae bacterium]|nr:hypothetical protein [Kofleriaceae bacterium]